MKERGIGKWLKYAKKEGFSQGFGPVAAFRIHPETDDEIVFWILILFASTFAVLINANMMLDSYNSSKSYLCGPRYPTSASCMCC